MLILKNVTAVQLHPAKVQEGVDIAIENDVIVAIGDALTQRYPDASFKEMHGRIVMPGIVCSHNHFYSGLSRGIMANIAPCPDFISTLKNLWWRLDRALDEESLYYSGLICSLEAIKSGCTSVIDHHASPAYIGGSLSTLRDAFLKVGLRAMTCFETTDRNNGIKELQEGVEENIRFARLIDEAKKATSEPYLVEAHIGAHAPFTVPDAGLEMLREAVKATGRGLHIHAAEDLYDVSYSHHWYGKDLLARLAQFDLIDSKTLVAHGLYLSKDDITLLNQRDAFLVHNARSNMNNHVGYNHHLSDIRNLALGTDGIGSDMFEEMKFAFFKHRDAGGPLWPDSFAKALTNGNELMSRNFGAKFGLLEAGYKADLTICDYNSPTPLLADNIAGGSKLNATPTRTDKKIAISLQDLELDWVDWDNGALRIGAMSRLQPLRDARFIPAALREALGFVYSRHVRNQSTIGGEIAARQEESVLLPVLLALDAELVFGNGETLSIEDYLACPCDRLLTEIIIKDPYRTCATRKISRSQAGLTVVTAAVAMTDHDGMRIALDGVASKALRLHDVEKQNLEGNALEQAVANAIFPQEDLRGSVAYKRYITGVLVADLYADCQQAGEEAV